MKGNSYLYRKIHSLLGVIPLGGFILIHLITNYSAYKGGPEVFADKVSAIDKLPLVLGLEIVFIWLPLLYHGVYGLYVAYQSRNNVGQYGYVRNWMFALQRITGIVTFVFVAWHVWQTRVQVALGHVTKEELGSTMHQIATNPVYYWIYVVGILAAVFHFSNGLWSFLVSWGITVGPRAQRVASYATLGLFVLLAAMFLMSLNAFMDESFAEPIASALSQ